MVLTYFADSEFDRSKFGERIVHLKGFAQRINYGSKVIQVYKAALLETLARLEPEVLVWDGDVYKDDSFTRLIPEIHQLLPEIELVMFRKSRFTPEERVIVEQNGDREVQWYCDYHKHAIQQEIKVFLTDPGLSYSGLGCRALHCTGSSEVVCFGGGQTVLEEFENAGKHVNFHIVPAHRPHAADRNKVEECALLKIEAANVRRVIEPHIAH